MLEILILTMETIRKLDLIFKRADLVKFAKMNQQSGQAEVDRKTIEEIINETHEAVPEPTEEELLENQEYLEKLQKKRKRRKWILGISGVVGSDYFSRNYLWKHLLVLTI